MFASGLNGLGGLIHQMGLAERIREAMGEMSPAELARRAGVTGGAVSQWLDGKTKSLRAEKAAKLEQATGYRATWIATGTGPKKTSGAEPAASPTMQPILSWEHEQDLPAGEFVMVPRLDVHLSAGAGRGRNQVDILFDEAQPQAFRADWIRGQHLKPNKLAAMTARGDSMEPTIFDGDSLLIDTGETEILDKKVYALWYDGGERVKRLFRLPGGGLRIKSDNPEYDTIELGPDHAGHVRVIGRVVHRSGRGGL